MNSSKTPLTPRIRITSLGSQVLKPPPPVLAAAFDKDCARYIALLAKLHSGRVVEVLLFALAILFAALGSGKDNITQSLSAPAQPLARAGRNEDTDTMPARRVDSNPRRADARPRAQPVGRARAATA